MSPIREPTQNYLDRTEDVLSALITSEFKDFRNTVSGTEDRDIHNICINYCITVIHTYGLLYYRGHIGGCLLFCFWWQELEVIWEIIIGWDTRSCTAIKYIIDTHETAWLDLKHSCKFSKSQLFPL